MVIAVALAGCGELHGLELAPPTPLARLHVRVTGDLDAVARPGPRPRLRVTVVWGQSWLPDASCVPPFENEQHAALAARGCGDPLSFRSGGFAPTESALVEPDGTATLELHSLPFILYGDMYSQIAYGSVFVYDDQNDDGMLDSFGELGYGASFRSMAAPDTRVAFRHGGFDDRSAFYPRRGCEPPARGYSLVSAGGFTFEQAVEAQARGELPEQDPAQCRQDAIDHEVTVALRPPEEVGEVACQMFGPVFFEPFRSQFPGDTGPPEAACTSIPDRGTGRARGRSQLLTTPGVSGSCRQIQHYVLRGCFQDPLCEVPDWNVPAPSWWPCPPEDPQ
jgi:hypothetical protein